MLNAIPFVLISLATFDYNNYNYCIKGKFNVAICTIDEYHVIRYNEFIKKCSKSISTVVDLNNLLLDISQNLSITECPYIPKTNVTINKNVNVTFCSTPDSTVCIRVENYMLSFEYRYKDEKAIVTNLETNEIITCDSAKGYGYDILKMILDLTKLPCNLSNKIKHSDNVVCVDKSKTCYLSNTLYLLNHKNVNRPIKIVESMTSQKQTNAISHFIINNYNNIQLLNYACVQNKYATQLSYCLRNETLTPRQLFSLKLTKLSYTVATNLIISNEFRFPNISNAWKKKTSLSTVVLRLCGHDCFEFDRKKVILDDKQITIEDITSNIGINCEYDSYNEIINAHNIGLNYNKYNNNSVKYTLNEGNIIITKKCHLKLQQFVFSACFVLKYFNTSEDIYCNIHKNEVYKFTSRHINDYKLVLSPWVQINETASTEIITTPSVTTNKFTTESTVTMHKTTSVYITVTSDDKIKNILYKSLYVIIPAIIVAVIISVVIIKLKFKYQSVPNRNPDVQKVETFEV